MHHAPPPADAASERATLDACHARLRALAAGEVEGLFGPRSVAWRWLREGVQPLVGMRAVMLQIAHPAVAAAGAGSSSFRQEFFARAKRTFATNYVMMFGDLDEALAAGRKVHGMHVRVRGVIPAEVSARHAGRPYRANDPEALAWVLATIIDATVRAAELLLAPPTPAELAGFYEEMKRLGLALGLPEAALPRGWAAFRADLDARLAGDDLEVGAVGRELGRFMIEEGWRLGGLGEAWLAGLLPPRLRDAYGLPRGRRRAATFEALRRTIALSARRLPTALRCVPAWHLATRRVALARGEAVPTTARAVHRIHRRWPLPMAV